MYPPSGHSRGDIRLTPDKSGVVITKKSVYHTTGQFQIFPALDPARRARPVDMHVRLVRTDSVDTTHVVMSHRETRICEGDINTPCHTVSIQGRPLLYQDDVIRWEVTSRLYDDVVSQVDVKGATFFTIKQDTDS